MRIVVAVSFALMVAVQSPAAESRPADDGGLESLGRELLDDLTPDVLRPQPAPRDEKMPAPRFDDLGEDIGRPSGPLALARVGRDMQHAESLLAERPEAARAETYQQASALQQDVLDQLDELIAQLSKQCQSGQCQPGDQPPKPSDQAPSKAGKSGTSGGRGQNAARDSTSRLSKSSAQRAADADTRAIVKDLWGHLPERDRAKLLQSFSEEFLPQYEREIEQYYRRLSEDEQPETPE